MIFKQFKLSEQPEFREIATHLEEVRVKVHDMELKLASVPKNANSDYEQRILSIELAFKQFKDLLMSETPNKQPTLSTYGRGFKKKFNH
jgi:hypothetical protein